MAPRCLVTMPTVLLSCILGMLCPAPAAHGRSSACCTSYTRKPVAFHLIKGFKEQSYMENCRIEAIIFYTTRNNKVCATSKDDWVRIALSKLSSKLKKMSRARPAADGAMRKRSGISSDSIGRESFSSGAGTFPNLSVSSWTFSISTVKGTHADAGAVSKSP